MAEMIGLSKNVLLDWMDLAASCRANNTPKDKAKQILNEKIGETIQSATNIRKIRTILFNVWYPEEDWFIGQCILMVLYEKWIWRLDPFAGIPCIKGSYEGNITSTYDSIKREASLTVKQSYLSVRITMSTSESESRSIAASIENDSGVNRLVFSYQNDPKAEVRDRSQIHYGSAMFTLAEKDHLQGTYFTDRKTTGDLDFTKVN